MGSFVSNVLNPISDFIFGPVEKPAMPDIPEPETPAAPAPSRKEDTGANIRVGADNVGSVKNSRVSGGGAGNNQRQVSSLGSLGRSSGLGF